MFYFFASGFSFFVPMIFDDLSVLIGLPPPCEALAFDVAVLIGLAHKKQYRPAVFIRLKSEVITAKALADHFTRRVRFSEWFVYFGAEFHGSYGKTPCGAMLIF